MRLSIPALALAITFAACAHASHMHGTTASPNPAAYGAAVENGYKRARAATNAFHALDSAVAAGYVAAVQNCVADSVHGAMGYHHINRALLDNKADVERPEYLIYERMPGGTYVLNAVEYIIPYRIWPRDSTPPLVMGQKMRQNDPLNLWNLHFWIWKTNPAGLFAEWNPDVHC
ncbi:MAG TPA: hypothetical protein VE967_04715 [Gemmatimonadaceae bacterium]|nr:hypothetical protein [Gemmatimonadaceae bacterium]